MDICTPDILRQAYTYSLKWAEGAFIIVIVLLTFNYWNVFLLENCPFPHFVSILYVYLILNGIFLYRRYTINVKSSVASGKTCAFCGSPLLINTYICSKCDAIVKKPEKK
ncbi:hypothetical protein Mpet_1716 [Methanolacinia petrolearia DSM 11571]|uniref:Uncharacterized protein n=1 Tax=Methanolacinia petrolearia (strain DSM 11571 / OCM 486 / SEBR 4847) TaxID=679926 RepID=E1RHT1_METP4|nr:hypothetical protein [Methanolacinia petrolearia]ADN36469.1 hypothetical protein Mpet_1716 [Methanolacinia petrolearia DSM 11571]